MFLVPPARPFVQFAPRPLADPYFGSHQTLNFRRTPDIAVYISRQKPKRSRTGLNGDDPVAMALDQIARHRESQVIKFAAAMGCFTQADNSHPAGEMI